MSEKPKFRRAQQAFVKTGSVFIHDCIKIQRSKTLFWWASFVQCQKLPPTTRFIQERRISHSLHRKKAKRDHEVRLNISAACIIC